MSEWISGPPEPTRPAPVTVKRRAIRTWGGAIVAGAVLLATKGKFILLALSKAKFLTPLLSAFASVGAYALAWGWQFAVGFTAMLMVHELGHAVELKRQGVPTGPITFIPFLGAFITMKRMPSDVWKEARMAYAGPLIGSLAAVVALALGAVLDSDLLKAIAYTGFLLNLFNLIPISPLDGGRIVAAVHRGVWVAGIGLCLVALVVFRIWFMLLILAFAGFELYRAWKQRGTQAEADYYRLAPRRRAMAAAAYVGLAAALFAGMAISEVPRPE